LLLPEIDWLLFAPEGVEDSKQGRWQKQQPF
jgi:hypothetical protein